jgi:hypothetical protein
MGTECNRTNYKSILKLANLAGEEEEEEITVSA